MTGMNKLIVNHLERIFVTSDCATIMRELEVAHPAAKMVVMAASMQEAEVCTRSNGRAHSSHSSILRSATAATSLCALPASCCTTQRL